MSLYDEIKARCDKATPAPWTQENGCTVDFSSEGLIGAEVSGDNYDADANFIAHARTDVPLFLKALELAIEDQWYPGTHQPEPPGYYLQQAQKELEKENGIIR